MTLVFRFLLCKRPSCADKEDISEICLQSQHEDLQMEQTKLHESFNKLKEDNDVMQTQHNAEYQQLKQEKANELASLKGDVTSHIQASPFSVLRVVRQTTDMAFEMSRFCEGLIFGGDLSWDFNKQNWISVWASACPMSLADEVANLQRKNFDLQKKLDLLMQSNQYNMVRWEKEEIRLKCFVFFVICCVQ